MNELLMFLLGFAAYGLGTIALYMAICFVIALFLNGRRCPDGVIDVVLGFSWVAGCVTAYFMVGGLCALGCAIGAPACLYLTTRALVG